VIEDNKYKYFPHYYYDDHGEFLRRDNQNHDQGYYRNFADGIAAGLVKDKDYPPALSKQQVEAIIQDERGRSARERQNAQKNDNSRLSNVEKLAKDSFIREQERRTKFKMKPLTLEDYNGDKYRGKYKLGPVKTLPEEVTTSSSSNSNAVISNTSSSSSAYAQSSLVTSTTSSPSSSPSLKITIVTSQSNNAPSSSATLPLIINSNNSNSVSSSKNVNQSQVKGQVDVNPVLISQQDQKTPEKDQKK